MKTAFSAARMADSKTAHLAARTQIYPLLFPGCRLAFSDVTKTVRDMDYAIDVEALVRVKNLRGPLWFTIQERWRFDLQWMGEDDVTVTEWNLVSNQPSELFKFGAHLFVYGFYDKDTARIIRVAAVDVPRLLHAVATARLKYTRRRRGDQDFLAFRLDDLADVQALLLRLDHIPRVSKVEA